VKTKLPPLTSLRAFDAVARAASLKEAAGELSLTVSAVSHQIRNLEEHLGVALLRRHGRGVELTPTGARFAAHVQRAFGELHHGVRDLMHDPDTLVLRVSVTPVFGMELLMPRLPEFERRHPGLRVILEMSEAEADFSDEHIDIAIRAGLPPPPTLFSEELFTVQATPVCAPKLLTGSHPLRRIEDLKAHTLIMLCCAPELSGCWRRWIEQAGYADLVPAREVAFDTFAGALHAAECGVGVLLAPEILLARFLRERKLVAPFPISVTTPWVYRFVCRREAEHVAKIRLFRNWIKAILQPHTELADRVRSATATASGLIENLRSESLIAS
jgi:LysR family glycine cleavage system transcriptional activator